MRFTVVDIKDGPWLVLDLADGRKIVASCFDLHSAESFAALMNGDVRSAMARRDAAIAASQHAYGTPKARVAPGTAPPPSNTHRQRHEWAAAKLIPTDS